MDRRLNASQEPERAGYDAADARTTTRARRLWVALAVWMVLLLGANALSARLGLYREPIQYVFAVSFGSLAVAALVAFARLAASPTGLRPLRFIAVLLPSAFVLGIELVLFSLEIDKRISETTEHVVAAALLSCGAIPFSVFIFRVFTRLRDELARRAASLERLHETSMALSRESALPKLYGLIVDGARSVTGADRAVLLAPDGRLVAVPPGEPVDGEQNALREAAAGSAGELVAEGHPLMAAPLAGGPRRGALAVTRRSGFGEEDRLLLDMYAVAASAGLDNLLRMEEAQLLAAVEERERIARDLHDDTGQLLGFLTAQVQAVRELLSRGLVDRAQDELAELERAARLLSGQVREAILGLRAKLEPDQPLGSALRDYVAEFGIQAGLDATFEGARDTGSDLPAQVQYQLFRIAQQALSNVRRHARAHRVTVRLAEDDGAVRLSVVDDGIGFDPDGTGGGFGLKTMAERARTLGGAFEVLTGREGGTEVRARVPIVGR